MSGAPRNSLPDSEELVSALLDPGFWPHDPARVELHETHISWVFVADDLAYKVKKPLRLPFLDYGTLERRREMCRQELILNRRLAPDYYLDVRAIARDADGSLALVSEEDPGAVEFVVEMRAIPQRRTLDRLLVSGEIEAAEIARIGERLALFHSEAEAPPDPGASVPRLVAALEENLTTTRELAGGAIPDARLSAAEDFTAAFLPRAVAELERRAATGLVVDGHGDLRAEHVLVTDPIQVYDCIEFDPGLREIDVAADLAFLLMDVERLGAGERAEELLDAYRGAGGDPGDARLLAFLCSYRAWVRAKVALFEPDAEAGVLQAAELHALGHRFAWRARLPFLLVVCGVAASGKSTLAAELAELSGLPVVDADTTRKRLAGLGPTERAGPEHYTEDFSLRTYRELGAAAAAELAEAGGVIVDATARRLADRDAFRAGLGECSAPLLFARCEAPDAVLLERARERARRPGRVSDADVEVVERQLGSFEPLDEVAAERVAAIDTEQSIEGRLRAVEALLDTAALGG
jgi:aminoglycoside phosphotransferase family enzyme/predicted kinase